MTEDMFMNKGSQSHVIWYGFMLQTTSISGRIFTLLSNSIHSALVHLSENMISN